MLLAGTAAASEQDPSFGHGVGETIRGVFFEWPLTVIDATLTGPPVLGTLAGCLAGVSRAFQRTLRGLREVRDGFDPWGIKRSD